MCCDFVTKYNGSDDSNKRDTFPRRVMQKYRKTFKKSLGIFIYKPYE
jgi:hypothetical protein